MIVPGNGLTDIIRDKPHNWWRVSTCDFHFYYKNSSLSLCYSYQTLVVWVSWRFTQAAAVNQRSGSSMEAFLVHLDISQPLVFSSWLFIHTRDAEGGGFLSCSSATLTLAHVAPNALADLGTIHLYSAAQDIQLLLTCVTWEYTSNFFRSQVGKRKTEEPIEGLDSPSCNPPTQWELLD